MTQQARAECANARVHPLSGMYRMGCDGCAARSLARSQPFHDAAKRGKLTPGYRMALSQFLPKLPIDEAHRMVKEWVT